MNDDTIVCFHKRERDYRIRGWASAVVFGIIIWGTVITALFFILGMIDWIVVVLK